MWHRDEPFLALATALGEITPVLEHVADGRADVTRVLDWDRNECFDFIRRALNDDGSVLVDTAVGVDEWHDHYDIAAIRNSERPLGDARRRAHMPSAQVHIRFEDPSAPRAYMEQGRGIASLDRKDLWSAGL